MIIYIRITFFSRVIQSYGNTTIMLIRGSIIMAFISGSKINTLLFGSMKSLCIQIYLFSIIILMLLIK